MPNDANVAALEALLREAVQRQLIRATFVDYRQFAAWLADQGVLVLSALTHEQVEAAGEAAAIDRIAKGADR